VWACILAVSKEQSDYRPGTLISWELLPVGIDFAYMWRNCSLVPVSDLSKTQGMQLDSVPDLRLATSACNDHLELKLLVMEPGDLDIFSKPAKPSW
jgi:hypothetical protein